jgi:hypothetical protein
MGGEWPVRVELVFVPRERGGLMLGTNAKMRKGLRGLGPGKVGWVNGVKEHHLWLF